MATTIEIEPREVSSQEVFLAAYKKFSYVASLREKIFWWVWRFSDCCSAEQSKCSAVAQYEQRGRAKGTESFQEKRIKSGCSSCGCDHACASAMVYICWWGKNSGGAAAAGRQ
jgi:hypothetical protein